MVHWNKTTLNNGKTGITPEKTVRLWLLGLRHHTGSFTDVIVIPGSVNLLGVFTASSPWLRDTETFQLSG